MEVKPNYCKLSIAFSEGTIFRVPKYQRAYSWTAENVDQYCSDMYELYLSSLAGNPREHFLGGVVCVKVESDNDLDERNIYQLVDGQQRLSTTVLFFSRLVERMKALNLDAEGAELRERRTREYGDKFVVLAVEENDRVIRIPRISLSKRDEDFYDNLIRPTSVDVPTSKSHELLLEAKKVIDSYIDKVMADEDRVSLDTIKKLYQVVSVHCKVLLIKMSDVTDAYRLFQVINDRGRALTAGDLLRASSLGDLDISGIVTPVRMDELIDKWDEITKFGVKPTDDKLMQFYTSKTGKKIRRTALFETFSDYFFRSTVDIDANIVLLNDAVKSLKDLEKGNWPYTNPNTRLSQYQKNKLESLVVNLGHTHCMPFLLSATQLTEKKFYQIIFFLEKFFFIYKVALDRRIDPVSKIYYDQIKVINESPSTYQVVFFVNKLKDLLENRVSKADIHTYFNDLTYIEGGDNRAIKFILSSIEESYSWIDKNFGNEALGMYKHHSKNLPPDQALLSIEHIYPRNPSDEDLEEDLEEVKNQPGNLTLLYTQDNSEAANDLLDNKKAFYSASRLNFTKDLANKAQWRVEDCNERYSSLLQWFTAIFTFSANLRE